MYIEQEASYFKEYMIPLYCIHQPFVYMLYITKVKVNPASIFVFIRGEIVHKIL